MRFRRILVYASLEDDAMMALEQGAALARRYGSSLTLLRVLPDERGLSASLKQALLDGQRALLEERIVPLLGEGLAARVEVRLGSPRIEVIRSVLRDGHDLVLTVAEGAARGSGLFFGSTEMHLIRKCPCPVWILGRASSEGPRRVLAAIDPGEAELRPAVAARVMELATTVVAEDGVVHAASAWRAAGESLLRNRVRAEELRDHVRAERARAEQGLAKAVAPYGSLVPDECVHLEKGEARDVIPGLVEAQGYDVVVMGSLGREGIAGLLIGETAETVVRLVRCSVLVVKPPGFVSPLAPPEDERPDLHRDA